MEEKFKGVSKDPARPHLFGPGNNIGGRKPGSLTSDRARLTKLFVNRAETEWPEILDTIFRLAKEGQMKALDLITSYCLTRPATTHEIEKSDGNDITNVTKEVLLSIIADESEHV